MHKWAHRLYTHARTQTHTLSLSHTHACEHTFSLSLSHTHTHIFSPSLSYTHTHSLFHTRSLSFTHAHTHWRARDHSVSLFLLHTLSPSFSHTQHSSSAYGRNWPVWKPVWLFWNVWKTSDRPISFEHYSSYRFLRLFIYLFMLLRALGLVKPIGTTQKNQKRKEKSLLRLVHT